MAAEQKQKRGGRIIKRDLDHPPQVKPGPYDQDIVRSLYECRFLTNAHLVALTQGDKTSIEKRMYKLYKAGYVDRRPNSSHDSFLQGQVINFLDRRGGELYAQTTGLDPGRIAKRIELDRNFKDTFLPHALMLAHIRTVFTLATRSRQVELFRWHNDKEIKDKVAIAPYDPVFKGKQGNTAPVEPDSLFGLRWPAGEIYCMVEADRGEMAEPRFLEKLRAYYLWWRSRKFAETLKIDKFVVLTITLNAQRAENLFKLSRKTDDNQTGSDFFWFTTMRHFTLEQPEHILENIWYVWQQGRPVRVSLMDR